MGLSCFVDIYGSAYFKKGTREMNERIKELAIQAMVTLPAAEGPLSHTYFDKEKFAELIVGECLDIVNRKEYSYHEADPLWETSQLIKEHFGVEE